MKTIKSSDTKISKMLITESTITRVVDGDKLKLWVGIGWIDERVATEQDKEIYPTVTYNE